MPDTLRILDWEPTPGGLLLRLEGVQAALFPLTAARMHDLYRIESACQSPLADEFWRLHIMLSGGRKADPEAGEDQIDPVTPARDKRGHPTPATQALIDLFTAAYTQLHQNHTDRRHLNVSPSAPHQILETARTGQPVPEHWQKRHGRSQAATALRARAQHTNRQPRKPIP